SRRRHTRFSRDWSSDVCSSDLFKVNVEDPAIYDITKNILSMQFGYVIAPIFETARNGIPILVGVLRDRISKVIRGIIVRQRVNQIKIAFLIDPIGPFSQWPTVIVPRLNQIQGFKLCLSD